VNAVNEPELKRGNAGSQEPRSAGPLEVAKAVFWSFLGIRKQAAHEKDAVTIKPVHAILAGIIGAAIFVLTLIMLVRYITG
jgi:Protein of unknown function (DUF2970)